MRSLGGLGAFSSLAVRGAPAGHTALVVDGVPVSSMISAATDLNAWDLAGFSRLRVFRDGVPVDLGGAALGGAVYLESGLGPRADGSKNRFQLGYGSFGARRALAERRDSLVGDRLRMLLSLSYAGTGGGFSYFDDNGTPLNFADDSTARRVNNGYDHVQAQARARYRWASGTAIELGARALWRDQGVPGPSGVVAQRAHLATRRALVDAALTQSELARSLDASVRAHLLFERQDWVDLGGEIGLGTQDTTYNTWAGGALGKLAYLFGEHHVASFAPELRVERFAERDHLLEAQPSPTRAAHLWGTRISGAAGLADEITLGQDTLVLLPALRLDALSTRAQRDGS
ncbi:MAG: TonB-dependent receptor plug domain-containing protein, partial [Chloroflexota bacterium]